MEGIEGSVGWIAQRSMWNCVSLSGARILGQIVLGALVEVMCSGVVGCGLSFSVRNVMQHIGLP